MVYIPPHVLEDTVFPTAGPYASGKDLTTLIRLLKEKWVRFFPIIDYYCLNYTPTKVDHDAGTDLSGTPQDTTKVDDLWGEDVPVSLTAEWIQPHSVSIEGMSADATNTRAYLPAKQFNLPIQRSVTDKTLKRFGIDEMRDVLVTFLTPVLDELSITVKVGDKFVWDGESYEIEQAKEEGFWQNTNVPLYVIGNCKRLRLGS